MGMMCRYAVPALGALALAAAVHAAAPDAVYFNGNIYTMNPAAPRAGAFSIYQGEFAQVGADALVLAAAGPETVKIDLGGRTVLPGLIDAHGHLLGLGSFALGKLDLSHARSFDEVVGAVAAKVAETPKGTWILGGRWDHESWPARELPHHAALSAISPDHPVWLTRVDGHAGLANAAAISVAGLSTDVNAPAGGAILRDAAGAPTGVFVDRAMSLITAHISGGTADTAALVEAAQRVCFEHGLTGMHDAGVSPAELETYRKLAASGALQLRVYAMVHGADAATYFRDHPPQSGPVLSVRACKVYMDGALGSRGAWLLEPYADRRLDDQGRPYRGLTLQTPQEVEAIATDALRRGYQVCTHAIGDAANRAVLDAYLNAQKALGVQAQRFRIEHAQVIAPADLPRFGREGVVASIQPTHATSDMRWAAERLGPERLAGAYAWATLLRQGASIAAGSDFPVESPNPFWGVYAACARQDAEGAPVGGWRPHERLTRTEAFAAFTRGAAYAGFAEGRQGMIQSRMLADFVVVDRDVMTCALPELRDTRVLRTVVGGEVVYAAPEVPTTTTIAPAQP